MGSRTAIRQGKRESEVIASGEDVGPVADSSPTEPTWPLYMVGVATAGFIVLFTALVLVKHAHLGTRAFDLGIFDQGLWLLSQGEEPFVTMRGLHLFGDHSSYILVPLAPLYWLWSDVRVLLILTVLALAAGGPLVYAAARTEGLRRAPAAALAVAFLTVPALQWQVWDVFHPETLAIPMLLAAYLLTIKQRPIWALITLAVVLLVKEDAALIVVPLALYLGLRARRWWLAVAGSVLGLGALIVNFAVLLPHFSPTGRLVYTGRYAAYGDSMLEIAWGVATSPFQVLGEVFAGDSLLYMAGLVLPFLVALAAPRVLLIGIPTLLANVLSIHFYQAEIEYHYTAYLIAVVAIAAIVGTKRLMGRDATNRRRTRVVMGLVLVTALVGTVLAGPWGVFKRNPWAGHAERSELVGEAVAMIPPDASVTADSRLAVHLAHRRTIYVFPNPHVSQNWSAGGVNPPPQDDFDWVVVRHDLLGMDELFLGALEEITRDGQFTRVLDNDEVTVWQRAEPAP